VFGITQKSVDFALGTDSTDIDAKINEVLRHIEDNLLGEVMTGVTSALAALSKADLTVMENEPRVRDRDLGRRLGFSRDRVVRDLIKRHLPELETHGLAPRIAAPIVSGKGRVQHVQEYWLNEAQALLICMFSETAQAAEVRRQVISVFLAWRRGELESAASRRPPSAIDLTDLDRRMRALERAIRLNGLTGATALLDGEGGKTAQPFADAVTHLPLWTSGKRPKFWSDREVRAFVIAAHRQMTIDECCAAIIVRFGTARAVPRTTLGRFWKLLDRVRGGSGTVSAA